MDVSCQFHAPAALPPGTEPTVPITPLESGRCVNKLVKYILKYVRNVFITHWMKKKLTKWDPPFSVHYPQHCDTVLQIDW
jgi:hypothetical protein